MKKEDKPFYVVVGTKNLSCFFGELLFREREYVDLYSISEMNASVISGIVLLKNAQMIVVVADETRTWFDLALTGPSSQCAVSNPVPFAALSEVRDILQCTEEAAERWRSCPWIPGLRIRPVDTTPNPKIIRSINQ
jgi:hypothetical protein